MVSPPFVVRAWLNPCGWTLGEQQGVVRKSRSGILAVSQTTEAARAPGSQTHRFSKKDVLSESTLSLTPPPPLFPHTHCWVPNSVLSNDSPFRQHSTPWVIHLLGCKVPIIFSFTPCFGLSFKVPLGDLFCLVFLTIPMPLHPHRMHCSFC